MDEVTSISKLLFRADLERLEATRSKEQVLISGDIDVHRVLAYSEHSDRFFSGYEFQVTHQKVIKGNRSRLWRISGDSDTNKDICFKSKLVTKENCLPTSNLNTQIKIYQKKKKNRRLHSMRTRSQSRGFGEDTMDDDWSSSEGFFS
ncbi:unnamed protein product [Cuscuta epithymum]|uniref:Uncharacterized protein n=1 Tax=Cuscuta epithymum TaxID=186058 RepID=A0AAV0C8Q4_9ASTE|nr:unnamed protein product [Cuscuta epithymum]